ncbi:MAG: glycosyltransferase family 4 protein [Bacteroides sp.]|nr:glycosyltransferase family 4 protein [Bacteroides sp.]
MRKKVLLINNGYPSERYPEYTSYIRSIEECIIGSGQGVDRLVIRFDRPITPIYKLLKYILFWLKCLTARTTCDTVYINHLPFAWPLILNPFIRKKRTIVHWHGNDLVGKSILSAITSLFLTRYINNSINIVPSQYFSTLLEKKYPNLKHKVHISPSGGVDTRLFSTERDPHKDVTIGFASALTAEKGADILIYIIDHKYEIETAAGCRVTFNIINYGKEAEYYIGRILQTDMNCCKVFDRMDKSQMPSFYQTIDLLVFPSQRLGESLGLGALEAMSCGVPVVAHNICAFPEYIKPGVSGELVEVCTSEQEQNRAFLTSVVKAINNIESYTPRQVVEANYSQASVISFYRKVFEAL